jgi:hypothetical protein
MKRALPVLHSRFFLLVMIRTLYLNASAMEGESWSFDLRIVDELK